MPSSKKRRGKKNGKGQPSLVSSNSPPQTLSSSSAAAEPSTSIPGFHFDPQTGRYYSLHNAPAEFLKRLNEEQARKKNEEAIKRFKASQKVVNQFQQLKKRRFGNDTTNNHLTSSSPSPPPPLPHNPYSKPKSFLGAIFHRETGHIHQRHRHFLQPLSALCASRLPLPQDHPLHQQQQRLPSSHQIEIIEREYGISSRVQQLLDWCEGRTQLLYTPHQLGSNCRQNFSINLHHQGTNSSRNTFLLGPLVGDPSFSLSVRYQSMGIELPDEADVNPHHQPRSSCWWLKTNCDQRLPVVAPRARFISTSSCAPIFSTMDHALVAATVPGLLSDDGFVTASVHLLATADRSSDHISRRHNSHHQRPHAHRHRLLRYNLILLPPEAVREEGDLGRMYSTARLFSPRVRVNDEEEDYLPVKEWPWTDREEEGGRGRGSTELAAFGCLLRRLSYSVCRQESINDENRDAHLTCIDLQFLDTELGIYQTGLRSDSLPTGVLSGFSDGTLQLAEWSSAKRLGIPSHFNPSYVRTWKATSTRAAIRSVKFHPTRPSQVVIAADQGFLGLFDTRFIKEGDSFSRCKVVKPMVVFEGHHSTTRPTPPFIDPSGSDLVVCAGEDGLVRFWSTATGKLVNIFEPFPGADREEAASVRVAYSSCFKLVDRGVDDEGCSMGEALLVISNCFAQMYVAGVPDFEQTMFNYHD